MPLLSAIGGGSEYAYRGNYDNFPDPFSFTNQVNLLPGTLATTTTTITGINYKSIVSGTNGILISINGGAFISSPQTIRNGQTITLNYQTTTGTDSDFNKTVNITITVGKRTASWLVKTKLKDNSPDPFNFDSISEVNPSTIIESNIITLSGLENGYTNYAFISSGSGTFRVNGGTYVSNAFVSNNQTIQLRQTSAPNYETTVISQFSIGELTAPFTVTTRSADSLVNPIVFTSIFNSDINVEQLSNIGTITGADAGIPLIANISTNARISINSSPSFVFGPVTVFNGDTIRIRIFSTSIVEFSQTTSAVLNISGILSNFNVTTRPRPIKTFPNSFTFTALTNVDILTFVESNVITLSGMTSGDFGTATISGASSQFKVIRNGTIVRNYSSSSFQVLNGDQIQLNLISGGELANVQATFGVSGTDTFTDIAGIPGLTSANWLVTSKSLSCKSNNFSTSLINATTNQPGELKSTSFVVSGLGVNCDNIVTTSNANSYLVVKGSQGTNLNVSNGDTVEVYMTSPAGGTTRTTTVVVRRPSGADAVSAPWSVTTTTLPSITIFTSPSSIFIGNSSTLSWSVDYATNLVSSTFGATSLSGNITVNPSSTTIYSLTAVGPGGTSSKSTTLTVSPQPTTVTLTASPSSVPYNKSTTLTWSSSNANSVSSSNFGAATTSGSITLFNLKSTQTYSITVSGSGGSATATAQVTVAECIAEISYRLFATYMYGKIIYNNGSTDPYGFQTNTPFFLGSLPNAYTRVVKNDVVTTNMGILQDTINGFYKSINGRLGEFAGIEYWIGDFISQNRTFAGLENAIRVSYNQDEKKVVDAAGGRRGIFNTCDVKFY